MPTLYVRRISVNDTKESNGINVTTTIVGTTVTDNTSVCNSNNTLTMSIPVSTDVTDGHPVQPEGDRQRSSGLWTLPSTEHSYSNVAYIVRDDPRQYQQ